MSSSPAPPSSQSLPALPSIVSLPAAPSIVSASSPPSIWSSPAPPRMLSRAFLVVLQIIVAIIPNDIYLSHLKRKLTNVKVRDHVIVVDDEGIGIVNIDCQGNDIIPRSSLDDQVPVADIYGKQPARFQLLDRRELRRFRLFAP